MFLNPKPKVARLGKVAPTELVLLHLEAALEDLLGLGPANRDVHGDLLVAPDAELAHGVARLGRDRRLARQLFEDFGGSRQTVARLSDGYVCIKKTQQKWPASGRGGRERVAARTDDELFKTEITHCVCRCCLGLGLEREGCQRQGYRTMISVTIFEDVCFGPSSLSPTLVVQLLCCFGLVCLVCPWPEWLATVQLPIGNLRLLLARFIKSATLFNGRLAQLVRASC